MLRGAAPSLRFNLPDAIAVRKRVRKGTGPNDGLPLDRYSESPWYDSLRRRALDIPESWLVGEVLVGHTEIRTPFRYVTEPIGWSIRVQPAIGRDTVDDDCSVLKNAKEKLVVLGVEAIDVRVD